MDKRTTIGAICLTVSLILGYMWLRGYVDRKYPPALPQDPLASVLPAPTPTTETSPATTQASLTTMPTVVSAPLVGFNVAPTTRPTQAVTLGSATQDDPTYSLALTVNPRGASLGQVLLNQFKHPADFKKPEKDKRPYVFEESNGDVPGYQPLATKSIRINGGNPIPLDNVDWTLESADTTSAVYSVTINSGDTAALKIVKSYRIHPKADDTFGYEVLVNSELQNLSGQNLTVKGLFDGPSLPPRELSRPPDRQIIGGYLNDNDRQIEINAHAVEEFKKDNTTIDVSRSKEGRPLGWVGTATVYFTSLIEPGVPNGPKAPKDLFGKITATAHIDPLKVDATAEDWPVSMSFETVDVPVDANTKVSLPINVYLGPRFREVLTKGAYGQYPRQFGDMLVVKTGPCSVCTFTWLINGLVWLLGTFHFITKDWGIAIIVLVGIVRTLLHPITKRSQVQMMKMGKLGPEIEKLKTKYGDDKEGLNRAMMSFYKENGAGQVLGCLPMFLQMPIWIALYSSLQTTFQLRQASFLWGFTWIKDLAKPDYLVQFSQPVSLLFGWIHFDGINILPILLGVVFFINQKYTPKPVAATPEQAQQQKMMQWMTLLFPMFLYSGPSGLNLYILTSTTFGIIESKIIRRHIKQREELEKAIGPVVVDVPATRGAKKSQRTREKEEPEATGLIARLGAWWAGIQEKVEQARQQADKRK